MTFIPINPGGGQVTVSKSLAASPGLPASIRPLVVFGYSTTLAVATPQPFTRPGVLQSEGGTGSAVEAGAYLLSPDGNVQTIHVVNTGAENPGSYGSITPDVDPLTTVTLEGDSVVKPDQALEVIIRITVGGALTVDGIFYDVSLDGGFSFAAPRALGTATSITLPYGGGKFNFLATDALVLLANNLKAKYEAHRVLTSGSVHGAADTTNDVTAPNATNLATAITLLNDIRTQYEAHRVLTSGSVHGAADSTNAVSAPAASDLATAIALANDLRTQYEAHRVLTSGSVHGAADSTNTITEDPAGVVTAGDTWSLETVAPSASTAQIQAAIRSLWDYPFDFGGMLFADPITGALADVIAQELPGLWERNKFKDVVASFRPPNAGETVTQYKAAITSSFAAYSSTEIRVCTGGVRQFSPLMISSGSRARPLRPWGWAVAAMRAVNEPQAYLAFAPAPRGVYIKENGRALPRCFDENNGGLYSVETRTIGTRSDPQRTNGLFGVFATQGLLLYQADSPWVLGPYTVVVNYLLEEISRFLKSSSQPPNGYASAPNAPLEDEVRLRIQASAQSLADANGPDQGRCFQVQVVLDPSSGLNGEMIWTMTTVPNNYPINGARLTALLSGEPLSETITTQVGG